MLVQSEIFDSHESRRSAKHCVQNELFLLLYFLAHHFKREKKKTEENKNFNQQIRTQIEYLNFIDSAKVTIFIIIIEHFISLSNSINL